MNKHGNLSVREEEGGNRSITGKFFQGAIPSPDSMKEYQKVDPSIPLRLIQWTEDESKHRRRIEHKYANQSFNERSVQNCQHFSARIGLLFVPILVNNNYEKAT